MIGIFVCLGNPSSVFPSAIHLAPTVRRTARQNIRLTLVMGKAILPDATDEGVIVENALDFM